MNRKAIICVPFKDFFLNKILYYCPFFGYEICNVTSIFANTPCRTKQQANQNIIKGISHIHLKKVELCSDVDGHENKKLN